MLRGPLVLLALGVSGAWIGSLTAPRTLPTDFCRIDTAVSGRGLLSSLFGAASLFTGIRLREPAHS